MAAKLIVKGRIPHELVGVMLNRITKNHPLTDKYTLTIEFRATKGVRNGRESVNGCCHHVDENNNILIRIATKRSVRGNLFVLGHEYRHALQFNRDGWEFPVDGLPHHGIGHPIELDAHDFAHKEMRKMRKAGYEYLTPEQIAAGWLH